MKVTFLSIKNHKKSISKNKIYNKTRRSTYIIIKIRTF